ncbi:PEP-CTERM sorting domain-containing protein [Nostoc sp.]|uniref:PEP-CTERM sorting domain-containing protein n=1 Tax=Nostoc sp. TaxID=1180 RepID=UPI002FF93EF4
MTKNNRKKAVAQAISTAVALGWVIMQVESAQAATFDNLNYSGAGSLQISTGRLRILDGARVNFGQTGDGLAGNITLTIPNLLPIGVREESAIAGDSDNSAVGGNISINSRFIVGLPNEPSAIAGDSNNSGAGGNIIVTSSDVILLTTVPEPSAIGGIILAGSLAWLAKRKQAAFRKAKV